MTNAIQSAQGEPSVFVSSRYNFCVPSEGDMLLYNASSGSVLRLKGQVGTRLGESLAREFVEVIAGDLPEPVWSDLLLGGFLVPSGTNEVSVIQTRFLEARAQAPVFLTMTTTQDCNLGCYYCYEERSKHKLSGSDIDALVGWVAERIADHPEKLLHVSWYGGEPLLNSAFMEAASMAIQQYCSDNRVAYTASIVSNGTLWPADVIGFAKRHKLGQAQISFDGLRDNHNQRRRYRPGYSDRPNMSSFDQAVGVVDQLLECCRVLLRLNLDRGNYGDLSPFIDFANSRGWFKKLFPCVLAPARLSSYTAKAEFMRRIELPYEELDNIRAVLREVSSCGKAVVDEDENSNAFAFPRSSVCAALARTSEVIGAEGLRYKCCLQVGETHRAVGKLGIEEAVDEQMAAAAAWWNEYDPTTLPNCSRCSFLPVCWGGCPIKHLHKDTQALEERSLYWRNNLPRLITQRFGALPPAGYVYEEKDQFR